MKTNPHLILLTALAFSAISATAGVLTTQPPICGGADDDQFKQPSPPPLFLCGGADDDQRQPPPPQVITPDFDALWNQAMGVPEHKGLLTDPLGIPPPPQQRQPAPAIQQFDRMPTNEIIAILIGLPGDDDSDTLTGDAGEDLAPPPFALLAELSRIVGGDGADFNNPARRDAIADYLLGYLMRRPDFAAICGGNDNDSIVLLDEPWWLTLIYGETGSDSLWGGGGTDETWDMPMEVPLR